MTAQEEKPWYKDIADRYQFELDDLKTIHTQEEATKGYCALCEANESVYPYEYAYAYRDGELIAEGRDSEIYRFLMLRIFLDKYGTGKYPLPEINEIRVVGQSEEEAITENRKIMEILLHPLDTYEDLLARFEEAEKSLAIVPGDLETFDGEKSQDKTLNGTPPDWEDDHYRVYKPVGKDAWDVFFAVERGNGRLQFLLRIYGRRYLHEYILNNHLGAVG